MLESVGQAALRTLLLAVLVQLALILLRVRRPQLHLVAWTVVLLASLVMPALQWATPLRLPVLPTLNTGIERAVPLLLEGNGMSVATPASLPQSEPPAMPSAMTWLEALYLLVAGALLLRLATGVLLSLHLVHRATPATPQGAARSPVRISTAVTTPVTIAHVILLPPDSPDWPAAMRDAVLAHERAHVARMDFAMLLAARINRAIFWFSPLSWWLYRRLATLTELASDDQALSVTRDPLCYARVLLAMGRRPGPLHHGLPMARQATLQRRIERILSGTAGGPARPIHQTSLATAAATLAILSAGTNPQSAPRPAAPLEAAPPLLAMASQQPPPAQQQAMLLRPPMPPAAPAPDRIVTTQSAPALPAATTAPLPDAPATAQPTRRQQARAMPQKSAPRTMPQHSRSPVDPSDRFVPQSPQPGITAATAPAVAATVITIGAPIPVATAHTLQPSCTGVYLPKPGTPRFDPAPNFVQANYFRASDGTPWLKLLLGMQVRAKLTGMDVQRTSIHTTVVTALPQGTDHVAGTTRGSYGAISFECAGSSARL